MNTMRPLALLLSAAFLSACALTQRTPPTYVSLGDSITAGYQSGGLTAAGQQAAYPVLLAARLGSTFTSPTGQAPGCPPPIGGGKAGPTSCQRVTPGLPTNNFAVPGARVEDLLSAKAGNVPERATPLYRLILGQDTQVSAALKARPTLITVWVGANNVLGATLAGDPSTATPPAQFEASYARLLDALAPSGARIVLLTVPNVSTVPALVPGALLAVYGVANRSCLLSSARISLFVLANPQTPRPLSCDAPYALTPAEARQADATVAAYNDSIRRLAARHGYAVFDVNGLTDQLDVRPYNPLDRTQPFGPDFSLDGIHPSSHAHVLFARALAAFLNGQGFSANSQ